MSPIEIYRGLIPAVSPSSSGQNSSSGRVGTTGGDPAEFQKLLETNLDAKGVNLSQHAETRIRSRSIPWTPALEKRISQGMDQAQEKGSREALILAGDVAVIANVKSRTVVTAMDSQQLKGRVFTNIDSAVLV